MSTSRLTDIIAITLPGPRHETLKKPTIPDPSSTVISREAASVGDEITVSVTDRLDAVPGATNHDTPTVGRFGLATGP